MQVVVQWTWCLGLVAAIAVAGCTKGKAGRTAKSAKEQHPSGVISLEGMYRYVADAGLFEDCATGVTWRVATEGDNAALESAYGKARKEAGSPLLVTVDGRLDLRKKAEGVDLEKVLIVERFERVWPRETCGSLTPTRLEGVVWSLLELNGKPIVVSAEATAPTLELNGPKKSAYGFGGCNRFFGSYELGKHNALRFGPLGATRMLCPAGDNQEQAYLTALGKVTRYDIHGSKLLLYANDEVIARFQAQNLLKTD